MTQSGHELRKELTDLLPQLRRFAFALAGHAQDADDLVQSAIVRALSQEDASLNAERLDSWMYRIIRNLAIDQQRRIKVRGVQAPIDDMIDLAGEDGRVVIEARSDLAVMQQVFNQLSADLRSIAMLVIINELSYREAADILEIPIGTVMSRVARARRALADGFNQRQGGVANAS